MKRIHVLFSLALVFELPFLRVFVEQLCVIKTYVLGNEGYVYGRLVSFDFKLNGVNRVFVCFQDKPLLVNSSINVGHQSKALAEFYLQIGM